MNETPSNDSNIIDWFESIKSDFIERQGANCTNEEFSYQMIKEFDSECDNISKSDYKKMFFVGTLVAATLECLWLDKVESYVTVDQNIILKSTISDTIANISGWIYKRVLNGDEDNLFVKCKAFEWYINKSEEIKTMN